MLQIWDTAGQERFRLMAPLYYRGAVAAILVFAVTDESSFDKLKDWVPSCRATSTSRSQFAIASGRPRRAARRLIRNRRVRRDYRRARVRDEREEQHRRGRALQRGGAATCGHRARATETGQPQLPDPLQDAPNQDVAENVLRVTQVYSAAPRSSCAPAKRGMH